MSEQRTALTLKEASKRLGIHPNTLRNWEQRGVVRLIRLPGSRYRRVPVSEVQRLAAQMHGQQAGMGNVWLEPPPDDPSVIAEGQALARTIQSELAALDQGRTLEETMQTLRGRSWS
jgi:excisionase family DNA binding protein